jgi:hypothetical protein
MGVYITYSSLPILSGRGTSLAGGMYGRFLWEMGTLELIMLLVPIQIIRGYIRGRCAELGIEIPQVRNEIITGIGILAVVLASIVLVMSLLCVGDPSRLAYMGDLFMLVSLIGIPITLAIVGYGIFCLWKKHGRYDLYYGTMACTIAPMYAITIILLSFTVQPYLMYNEATLLAKDTIVFGAMRHPGNEAMGFSMLERKATKTYTHMLNEAVNGKE